MYVCALVCVRVRACVRACVCVCVCVCVQVFIACPSSKFSHKFSSLGGVRVVTHHLKAHGDNAGESAGDNDDPIFDGFGALPPTESIDLSGVAQPRADELMLAREKSRLTNVGAEETKLEFMTPTLMSASRVFAGEPLEDSISVATTELVARTA